MERRHGPIEARSGLWRDRQSRWTLVRMTTADIPAAQDTTASVDVEKARRQLRWQLVAIVIGLLVVLMLMLDWRVRGTPVTGTSGRVYQHVGTARTEWRGTPATAWTYLVDTASFAALQRDWEDVLPLATAAAERAGTSVVIVEARAVEQQFGPIQRFTNVFTTATRVKGQWTSALDSLPSRR